MTRLMSDVCESEVRSVRDVVTDNCWVVVGVGVVVGRLVVVVMSGNTEREIYICKL